MPAHIREAAPRTREAAPRTREAAPRTREAAPNTYSTQLAAVVVALLRGLALKPAALAAVHRHPVQADMAT